MSEMAEADVGERQLMLKLAKLLDETRTSYATHIRKLKELFSIRAKVASPDQFSSAFVKTLKPLFQVQRRTASAERIVRFVSTFSTARDASNISMCDQFLEDFLKFLLVGAVANNRTVRFRACQIISEIILRLPDDAEVSNDLWDEVIECMKLRVGDKVAAVRSFAVRALSRFLNDSENGDVLELLLEVLPQEQNVDVRKTIVLSLPASNATSQAIIDCTVDVSESVRKTAYFVLANKFPLQSLSIKLRTIILQRGLADRSASVSKECSKLMKDHWLSKCCNGDPITLLKYLDVETYESVGDSVMVALLREDSLTVHDDRSIQQYISFVSEETRGESSKCTPSIQLMEAEIALYWRTVCRHLQMKALAKGSDAASTMGTEAAVYAAEASDNNDLLEKILPATVSDYVDLVKAHIHAGPNYRFASRQLLLLGAMLDFSDTTIRKIAGSFVQDLLNISIEHEVDENDNMIVIGDGINLGGDKHWADAVASLASKVHAASGEFEEAVLGVVEDLARPCRERTADFMQWMHSLAVTGLLLENTKSMRLMQGKAIEPTEILHGLLLPGAKHIHSDVQRVAVRCLGLFGLLERTPSEELVKQLRLSFVKGSAPISTMACKALMDLGMWHGPQEVDKALGEDLSSQILSDNHSISHVNFSETDEDFNVILIGLLYAGLEANDCRKFRESDENESVHAILGEGFAKFLLLSEKYPSIPASFHPLLLAKLIILYFSDESKELQRLKQCLSVFFEHYASLSAKHKECLSKSFIPVMRSMWPGINGNAGGSSFVVSTMRKRAVQASKFMLQMMQAPLLIKEAEVQEEISCNDSPESTDATNQIFLESSEEGLAIRIATEVLSIHGKKTAAEKSYAATLCRILILVQFGTSDQVAVKLMSSLLNCVSESVSHEKELVKEIKLMAERIKEADAHTDQELLQDQANLIFENLGIDFNLDVNNSTSVPQTPAPRSTRPARSRRRVRREETSSSDEEDSPTSAQSVMPTVPLAASARSQRASKTAALTKITTKIPVKIDEEDDDDEEGENSEITTEDSDESEH